MIRDPAQILPDCGSISATTSPLIRMRTIADDGAGAAFGEGTDGAEAAGAAGTKGA